MIYTIIVLYYMETTKRFHRVSLQGLCLDLQWEILDYIGINDLARVICTVKQTDKNHSLADEASVIQKKWIKRFGGPKHVFLSGWLGADVKLVQGDVSFSQYTKSPCCHHVYYRRPNMPQGWLPNAGAPPGTYQEHWDFMPVEYTFREHARFQHKNITTDGNHCSWNVPYKGQKGKRENAEKGWCHHFHFF